MHFVCENQSQNRHEQSHGQPLLVESQSTVIGLLTYASEVTTLWRDRNVCIIIIIFPYNCYSEIIMWRI